jgi:glycerol-3-phosphate dehydrogenase
MAVEMLGERTIKLTEKDHFIDKRNRTRFNMLTPDEKAALIKKDPAYGHVICRCETVTEGEILEAMNSPIPPRTIDGVKRRVGAGMGRCQGGFCGSRVLELLAKHYQCNPTEILQDRTGTYILSSKTKEV